MDTYYVTLKGIIVSADKRGEIDYSEVQDQMKAIYKRLKKPSRYAVMIFCRELGLKAAAFSSLHPENIPHDLYG